MGAYSEKTQRLVDKYIRQLVRHQPSWLRSLFDEDKVVFVLEEGGILSLQVDEELEQKTKNNAAALIAKYLEKHPTGILKTLNPN